MHGATKEAVPSRLQFAVAELEVVVGIADSEGESALLAEARTLADECGNASTRCQKATRRCGRGKYRLSERELICGCLPVAVVVLFVRLSQAVSASRA